jgi:hypothetical protein
MDHRVVLAPRQERAGKRQSAEFPGTNAKENIYEKYWNQAAVFATKFPTETAFPCTPEPNPEFLS